MNSLQPLQEIRGKTREVHQETLPLRETAPPARALFILGSGGDGVITAGNLLARSACHDGVYCQLTKLFGPQIRGGESGVWVQFGCDQVGSFTNRADIVVVLSWRCYPFFAHQLKFGSSCTIFYDSSEEDQVPEALKKPTSGLTLVPVPFRREAEKHFGGPRMRNIVLVGFLEQLLGLPGSVIPDVLERKFAKRGPEVVRTTIEAYSLGRKLASSDPFRPYIRPLPAHKRKPQLFLTGNDAVVLGALYSRCRFFAGYPITPASEILAGMEAFLPAAGGTVIQAEDEIAAICMIIGASFAGMKAMTATSGPGLSLMVEGIGLAVQMELPCVIVNVQRGGPSTGMPTKTEQSDLQLAVYGAHGDAPRVVLAAEDVKTCFDTTVKAFYIAEKYQTPVILLSDQFIAHREESIPGDALNEGNAFRKVAERITPPSSPTTPYKRFALDSRGPVTPMAIPGSPGVCYRTSGLIHNEDGSPTGDTITHNKMADKIRAKLAEILKEFPGFRIQGPSQADFGVLTWGSSAGPVCEIASRLTQAGIPTAVLVVELLSPLPAEGIQRFVSGRRKLAVVELSHSGQFARLLRANDIRLQNAEQICRGGGDPFSVEELYERLRETAE